MNALERMVQYVEATEDGCTSWTGGKDQDGYPMFWYNGRTGRAARILWELCHGPLPAGKSVCHVCDNPECLNLDHLFLGTPKENTVDALKKGRMTGPVKMTNAKLKELRKLRKKGYTWQACADRLGVSIRTVYMYKMHAYQKGE